MGRVVIATNWSGPTAFLTDDNSLPIPLDEEACPAGLDAVAAGPFAGHRWACPSVTALRTHMRRVYDAKRRSSRKKLSPLPPLGAVPCDGDCNLLSEMGHRARASMMAFSGRAVAEDMVTRLRSLQARLSIGGPEGPLAAEIVDSE